jgi:glycosyltransferase involved in cell wall biosynthesis
MPKVIFGGENIGSAQRYFRAEVPARSVKRYGWESKVCDLILPPISVAEISKDPRLRAHQSSDPKFVEDIPDVITLRLMDDVDLLNKAKDRSPGEMAKSIERARGAGQIVLCDLDDDIWNIPDWSPAKHADHRLSKKYRAYDLEVIESNINASDGCIVTTPQIEDTVKKVCPDANVFLIRNGIDPRDWELPKKKHKRLRVGWMGSASHHTPHIKSMAPALAVLREFDAEFVHIGASEHPLEEATAIYDALDCDVKSLPWVSHDQLAPWLNMCDLAIVPRLWSQFIEGQSTSSGLQWACAGVPFLATFTHEYHRLASLGAGVMCGSPGSWEVTLREFLAKPEKRQRLALDGKKAAVEHHGLAATGQAYDALFRKLMGG